MKVLSKILRILTLVLTVAGFVLFFTDFVSCTIGAESVKLAGAQLAFGGSVTDLGSLARSPKIIFAMTLVLLAAIAAGFYFSKNSKAGRWFNLGLNGVAGVFMLVVALSRPWRFFDLRIYPDAAFGNAVYTPFVLITSLVILAAFISSAAYILVYDNVTVAEAGGNGLTIPKKIKKFFREYKSEIHKIVWPGPKSVVKNTLIVLAMCAVLGVFIWLLDLGVVALIDLITK